MDLLDIYGVHTITVQETRMTPRGPQPGEPVTIRNVWVNESGALKDSPSSVENWTAQVAIRLTAPAVNVGAKVTLPSGKSGTVTRVDTADPGPLPMPTFRLLTIV